MEVSIPPHQVNAQVLTYSLRTKKYHSIVSYNWAKVERNFGATIELGSLISDWQFGHWFLLHLT